ncbi:flagellar export protein FliJ [Desulfogranum mediterraneum]|uniref:flagellar export protein FliJ n=1 Tax=Desulfogranum mediterraneum TaxID=160661 RepID=UPI000419C3A3|nr:flagellar export protein FliJ [Desulfogranum mediterraneum]
MQAFQLHAVLKFRRRLEGSARQGLATALEEEAKASQILARHQQELEGLYHSSQQHKTAGTTISQLIMIENRVSRVQEELALARETMAKVQARVHKQRQALLKASQDRQIIEKMEAQQNLAFRKYLTKKEQAMLDELAVLYHNR